MAYIGPEPIIVQDGGTGVQTLTSHGVVIGQGSSPVHITTSGTLGQVLKSNGPSADPTFQNNTDLHVAKFIVGDTNNGANFSNITAAIASAQGTGVNSTIFIQPGTYTENFTIPPGINLTAFDCDATTPNVTIVGKITMTGAGTCSISGICLQTNSDFAIAVTGSAASVLYLISCYINATNNNAISHTSSNSNSFLLIYNCYGQVANTFAYIISTAAAGITVTNCDLGNSAASTAPSTMSVATLRILNSKFNNNITVSGTGNLDIENSSVNALVSTGTGISLVYNSIVGAGSNAAITIGAGTTFTVVNSIISSGAANAIIGAGTLSYADLSFPGSAVTVTATTQTPLASFLVPATYTTDGVAYFDGKKLVTTTAGTAGQILTSNGAGVAPTYQNNDSQLTYVATAISYQVLVTDDIIGVTSNAAARTITMPLVASTTAGKTWTIKDEAGTAQSSNNITISGNGANIDGSSTFVINTNYGSASIYSNGTNYFIV